MHLELKAIKNQGKLLKIGQSILFIAILYVLYIQLQKFEWQKYAWSLPTNMSALIFATSLVSLNWYFEWKKWTRIAESIELKGNPVIRNGFYAGMLSGFLTPSALGNFIGRLTVVKKDLRPKVVSYTLFSNWAQFNVSLIFGFLSLFLIRNIINGLNLIDVQIIVGTITGLSLLLFFTIEKFPYLRLVFGRFTPSFTIVSVPDRLHFLIFSILRYLVFSFQFLLVIYAFQTEMNGSVYFWIWNLYLWSTLSPSLLMGKLFIRETLAVFVLTEAGVDLPIALLASLSVWLINNVLPSLYAYFKWRKDVVVPS
jgi:hypothetical protein